MSKNNNFKYIKVKDIPVIESFGNGKGRIIDSNKGENLNILKPDSYTPTIENPSLKIINFDKFKKFIEEKITYVDENQYSYKITVNANYDLKIIKSSADFQKGAEKGYYYKQSSHNYVKIILPLLFAKLFAENYYKEDSFKSIKLDSNNPPIRLICNQIGGNFINGKCHAVNTPLWGHFNQIMTFDCDPLQMGVPQDPIASIKYNNQKILVPITLETYHYWKNMRENAGIPISVVQRSSNVKNPFTKKICSMKIEQ